MARLVIAQSFVDALEAVQSARLRARVVHMVEQLETFPEFGSPDVRPSIRARFGDRARKIVIAPFDILYLYDEKHDVVHVDALVHQRRVR